MSQDDRLDELYSKYQADERFHELRASHPGTFFVPGDGPMSPDYMLIGEAPGRLENAKRLPFQGRAGINLVNLLEDLKINPFAQVFMSNVVKYWPRNSNGKTRAPSLDEINESREYLIKEIEIVQPKIVGLCGFVAIKALFPRISDVYSVNGRLLDNRYVPLYHPAVPTYNPDKKPLVVEGYTKLKHYLEG